MLYYIVGGAVRDILMGRIPQDADMAFCGHEEDFFADFPMAQKVGKTIHVYLVEGREYMPLYAQDITADLLHRDLTINALALDQQGFIHAHPFAFFDLRHGILRPASAKAFFQDTTRIYRLARFAATFPLFSIHQEAIRQAKTVVKTEAHTLLPAERVGREFLKALQAEKPSLFLGCLQQIQALTPWFLECTTLSSENFIRLGHLMDSIQCSTSQNNKEHLGLLRFLLWGAFFSQTKYVSFTEHPLYQLVLRLHLPMHFAKAAYFFASTCIQAQNLSQLPLDRQVHILHKAHTLGISQSYWQAIDHIYKTKFSDMYAVQALQAILSVHLPQKWRNKGIDSGKKLLELQCKALEELHVIAN